MIEPFVVSLCILLFIATPIIIGLIFRVLYATITNHRYAKNYSSFIASHPEFLNYLSDWEFCNKHVVDTRATLLSLQNVIDDLLNSTKYHTGHPLDRIATELEEARHKYNYADASYQFALHSLRAVEDELNRSCPGWRSYIVPPAATRHNKSHKEDIHT